MSQHSRHFTTSQSHYQICRTNISLDRPPLTAAEVIDYPEYPHAYWDLKAASKGKLDVAKGRGGPFKISWEVHGEGDTKLVVCLSILYY